MFLFWCSGVTKGLDTQRENIVSCTPARSQNIPFGGRESYVFMFLCFYVFMFLCIHKRACGHSLKLLWALMRAHLRASLVLNIQYLHQFFVYCERLIARKIAEFFGFNCVVFDLSMQLVVSMS